MIAACNTKTVESEVSAYKPRIEAVQESGTAAELVSPND